MLIKNTKSPAGRVMEEQRKSSSKDVDVFKQLIILTKQNQYLKTQLNCLKQQYEKVDAAKNRYKQKYKQIKRRMQNDQRTKKSQPKLMRRQNSGKIYQQPRFFNFSPIVKVNQSQLDVPSTKAQLHRIVSQPHLQQSQNKIIYAEDPYLIGAENQKYRQGEPIQKISKQIGSIFQLLQNIGKTMGSGQSNVSRFEQKFQNLEIALNKNLQEFKDHLKQLIISKKEQQTNKFHNYARDKSYSQQPVKNNQTQHKNEALSGLSPPQKDQQDPYGQRKKSSQQSNIESNISNNQINANNKNLQKCSDSISHKSLRNSKKIKQSKYLRQKSKGNKKDEDSDDSSTRSKWQMLNQIGKQLKNWKIAYSDQSLLQKSNQQNRKHKIQINQ